jgi:hypothetical protein
MSRVCILSLNSVLSSLQTVSSVSEKDGKSLCVPNMVSAQQLAPPVNLVVQAVIDEKLVCFGCLFDHPVDPVFNFAAVGTRWIYTQSAREPGRKTSMFRLDDASTWKIRSGSPGVDWHCAQAQK